jgi:glutathione peroxidase
MAKSDVNGDETNEVYKWLKSQKAGILGLTRIKVRSILPLLRVFCPLTLHKLKWNFEKFLIDKEGNVAGRWASTTTPGSIESHIEKLL